MVALAEVGHSIVVQVQDAFNGTEWGRNHRDVLWRKYFMESFPELISFDFVTGVANERARSLF